MSTTVDTERIPLDEAAHRAWEAKAELDASFSIMSFRTQLRSKLRLREVEVEGDMFDEFFEPHRRVGAVVDNLTFTLDENRALAVIAWRCEKKGCDAHRSLPVKDLVTLGYALARGGQMEATQPFCREHS